MKLKRKTNDELDGKLTVANSNLTNAKKAKNDEFYTLVR